MKEFINKHFDQTDKVMLTLLLALVVTLSLLMYFIHKDEKINEAKLAVCQTTCAPHLATHFLRDNSCVCDLTKQVK